VDLDISLINEFVEESREHLETIEDDLLELEKQKDSPDPDLVNKVFRAAHTLKGGAGFLGLSNINRLSHKMEGLLSMIRDGEIRPESKYIDILLEGADFLKAMLDDVQSSDNMDVNDLLLKIENLTSMENTPDKNRAKADSSKKTVYYANGQKLDIKPELIKMIPSNFKNCFLMKFDLIKLRVGGFENPLDFIKLLTAQGYVADATIVTPEIALEEINAESSLIYKVIFATSKTTSELKEQFELGLLDISAVTEDSGEEKNKKSESLAVGEETTPSVGEIASTISDKVKTAETAKTEQPKSSTLRIGVGTLDKLMTLAGELVLVRNKQLLLSGNSNSEMKTSIQALNSVTSEIQDAIMQTRMQPVGNVFNKFQVIVRKLSKEVDKEIEIEIFGSEVELDKTIVESLADPLTHIIRNSCDHGIEKPEVRELAGKPRSGKIALSAFHEGGQVYIRIKDDGGGVNLKAVSKKAIEKGLKTDEDIKLMTEKEIASLIMHAGFSTAETVSSLSGRGVGMDVVKTNIEKLGGTIELNSKEGKGMTIDLRLPLTLAIIPSLIVKSKECRFAIPQVSLEELVTLYDEDIYEKIEYSGKFEIFRLRNSILPLVRLSEVLENKTHFNDNTQLNITTKYYEKYKNRELGGYEKKINIAVVKIGKRRFALHVENIIGTEEIVVKPMHKILKNMKIYSGATIMGDGKISLILDIDGIAKHAAIFGFNAKDHEKEMETNKTIEDKMSVMLFNTGIDQQLAIPLKSLRNIEKINMDNVEKVSGMDFITINNRSTRIIELDNFDGMLS